ncbi:MAG: hypothetical protein ACRERX_08855, partial [Pseudomonas sp.]
MAQDDRLAVRNHAVHRNGRRIDFRGGTPFDVTGLQRGAIAITQRFDVGHDLRRSLGQPAIHQDVSVRCRDQECAHT